MTFPTEWENKIHVPVTTNQKPLLTSNSHHSWRNQCLGTKAFCGPSCLGCLGRLRVVEICRGGCSPSQHVLFSLGQTIHVYCVYIHVYHNWSYIHIYLYVCWYDLVRLFDCINLWTNEGIWMNKGHFREVGAVALHVQRWWESYMYIYIYIYEQEIVQ